MNNLIQRFKSIKRYADKRQFTLRFNVLDAPTDQTNKRVAIFFPRSGMMRYLKILFGQEREYVSFFISKSATKNYEAKFTLLMQTSFGDIHTEHAIGSITPGNTNVLILTFGELLHARLNNRVATAEINLHNVLSGYRVYNIKKEMTSDGWLVKML